MKEIVLSSAGVVAEVAIRAIPNHYLDVAIDKYVVMPNHIHAIVVIGGKHRFSPNEPTPIAVNCRPHAGAGAKPVASLSTIVGGFKAGVSRRCRALGLESFRWQALFHEHILRSNASVNAVRDYIDHNPENWMEDPYNPSSVPTAGDGASPVSTRKFLGTRQTDR